MYPNQNYPTQNTYRGQNPNYQGTAYMPQNYPQTPPEIPKANNNTLIIIIALALLAIGGIIVSTAVFISKTQEISALSEKLSAQQTIIDKNVSIGITEGQIATEDYLYIGEWGIKIKLPEGLTHVNYYYNGNSTNRTTVSINGIKGNPDQLPEFANTPSNNQWLGYIVRVSSGYGDLDGSYVASFGGYDFYYEIRQQTISKSEADIILEKESESLLKQNFLDPNNYSAI